MAHADTTSRYQQNLIWQLALFFDGHESTEWITFNLLEVSANVALFVPLGIFFVLLLGRGRWWLAILWVCGNDRDRVRAAVHRIASPTRGICWRARSERSRHSAGPY